MPRKAQPERTAPDSLIRERAYIHIQRKIASGELRARSAVSELALARELGSSRTPIREALGQLVAEGLLEQTPNRGAVVVKLTRQDIIELFELRESLEVFAVGKAARQASKPADLERLQQQANEVRELREELLRSAKPALDARQMHRFITCDLGFHTLLMRLADNSRILKVVNETRLLIRIFGMRRQGHVAGELDRIDKEHREILRAIIDQEADRAMQLIAEHIQNSRRERLDEFDHWEREASLRDTLPHVFMDEGIPAIR